MAILQIGAWTWMLSSYSQESSIEQAFRETFGDDRPCEVCRFLDLVEEKNETSSTTANAEQSRLLLILAAKNAASITPLDFAVQPLSSLDERLTSRVSQVPTPPPRDWMV